MLNKLGGAFKMLWLIILILYICLICSLANRGKENSYSNIQKNRIINTNSIRSVCVNNKETEIRLTIPIGEKTKESVLKTNLTNKNDWLFELGI